MSRKTDKLPAFREDMTSAERAAVHAGEAERRDLLPTGPTGVPELRRPDPS
jgi:hypothetical protein